MKSMNYFRARFIVRFSLTFVYRSVRVLGIGNGNKPNPRDIMIVTEENRPRTPDSWHGGVLGMAIKYCDISEDMTLIEPDFWGMLFEYWTEPFPVVPPKAYNLYGVQHLRSYIKSGWFEDWPNSWWVTLEEAFMYPEYIKGDK